jgi:chemotaxis protein MotA
MNVISWVGTFLGLFAVVGGQLLEGGSLGQILQGTAALIVVGGTLGATLLAYPAEDVKRAFELLPLIYRHAEGGTQPVIAEVVQVATLVRRDGLIAAEAMRAQIREPMLARGIKYVIDGFEPSAVREILDAEIDRALDEGERAAKVFEGAGGYAPTVGILGAVLGLIHVMTMLNEPSRIGEGIAVAFVATVYGVALANLVLLPWGNKLKRIAEQRVLAKELVRLGILGIQEGLNPMFIEERLKAHAGGRDEAQAGARG